MENIIDRFVRYIKYNTQSDEKSIIHPSTHCQVIFLEMLFKELTDMGLSEISLDENGYLMATVPSNIEKEIPVVAFLAHVDTSPDVSGKDVNPQFIENYNGEDLHIGTEMIMPVDQYPELKKYVGQRLITTDGNTLLGADDKAGVSAIMDTLQYLMANPQVKHGKIRVAFTPDEEIGTGMDLFDAEKLGADYAYTIDGGCVGEFEYESFNAGDAKIEITGHNVHPGYAKGKMINALEIALEIDSMLPTSERPQYTEGYEGYYHLISLTGGVEQTSMYYIIRDHKRDIFESRKAKVQEVVDVLNKKYGKELISLKMKDQYYNMREAIEPTMWVVDKAVKAMKDLEIEPIIRPIRGGTDGSRLSFMGVPCPNIFAGGENFHSRFEFISCQSLEKVSQLIKKIVTE
ncbi:MAG: peptidase T [Bacteroidetes bacterium]|nr:peptidase T [Bacteroidota bacterium]